MLDLINDFLRRLEGERDFSVHTLRAYKTDLTQFSSFLEVEGCAWPDNVTHLLLRKFLAYLRNQGCAKATIARKIAAIRSLFRYLQKNGIIDHNPVLALRIPKQGKKLPNSLDVTEIESFLNAPNTGDIKGLRDKAILETLYSAGIRVSELVGLENDDIDMVSELIKVKGKGKKERLVPIGRIAIEAIRRYNAAKATRNGWMESKALFLNKGGKRLTARSVARVIDGYIRQTGLNRKVSPHTFRHSFATHLLDRGAGLRAVQELLGHAKLSSTQIYTHVSTEQLRKIYDKTHPRA